MHGVSTLYRCLRHGKPYTAVIDADSGSGKSSVVSIHVMKCYADTRAVDDGVPGLHGLTTSCYIYVLFPYNGTCQPNIVLFLVMRIKANIIYMCRQIIL